MSTVSRSQNSRWISVVETILFSVRWILPLFYIGLVFVLFLYGITYIRELIELVRESGNLSLDRMKIGALDFVDSVMIANLIKMIITGSYNSFVSKDHGRPNENISSGTLKIKISTSIIVVSSIHLLRSFVADHTVWIDIEAKLWIFSSFLATTLVLGILEYLHLKGQAIEAQIKHDIG
jgi:uncharacterized protein (TIGR00645 family)